MHEIGGSTRRKPAFSRSMICTVMAAVLACTALTSLGAAPAGAPVWRVDGPDGGFFPSIVFAPSDPSRVYVNEFSRISRSDDGGASYEPLPPVPNGTDLTSLVVDPADRDRLMAIVCDPLCAKVVRSVDGGLTWHVVLRDEASFRATIYFGAGAAFVISSQGMLRSDDGGATWSPSGLGEELALYGVWFDPRRPSLVIAASSFFSDPVTVWRSEDGGRSWVQMPTPRHWIEVSHILFDPVRPGHVYALVDRKAVRSTDDGATWQGRVVSRDFWDIGVLGDGTLFLSPDGPRPDRIYGFLRSTDGGETFTPAIDPGNPRTARPYDLVGHVLPGRDPHQGIASGILGLWSTADSGRSWQPVRDLALHSVGGLRASAGGEPRVYAIAFSAIFAREGVPGGWRKVHRGPWLDAFAFPAKPLLGFQVDPADSLHLVAFNTAEMLDSRDGGSTWRSFAPAGLRGGYLVAATGMAVDWSTGAIYVAALENTGEPGGRPRLAVTRDNGATWERLRPFVSRHREELFPFLAVDPRDASVLWGKTTEAGLFRSGDGGHTWARIGRGLPAIPRRLQENRARFAFDPDDPQRMIVSIPGQGVWQSANGGRTFRPLGQGLETALAVNLANAADPSTGKRFWLAGVPSRGVFRLEGDRWTAVGTFAEPDRFSGAFVVDPVDPSVLYAGTFGRSVLRLDLD